MSERIRRVLWADEFPETPDAIGYKCKSCSAAFEGTGPQRLGQVLYAADLDWTADDCHLVMSSEYLERNFFNGFACGNGCVLREGEWTTGPLSYFLQQENPNKSEEMGWKCLRDGIIYWDEAYGSAYTEQYAKNCCSGFPDDAFTL